jgi:hypothetical protein
VLHRLLDDGAGDSAPASKRWQLLYRSIESPTRQATSLSFLTFRIAVKVARSEQSPDCERFAFVAGDTIRFGDSVREIGSYRIESVGAWRSLVAHLPWAQGVAGSNPVAPTIAPVAQLD